MMCDLSHSETYPPIWLQLLSVLCNTSFVCKVQTEEVQILLLCQATHNEYHCQKPSIRCKQILKRSTNFL